MKTGADGLSVPVFAPVRLPSRLDQKELTTPISNDTIMKTNSDQEAESLIEISFLAAEITFVAIWLFVRICVWIRQRRLDWKREAILLLMFINLAVIIRFVFFPRALAAGRVQPLVFEAAKILPLRINLIPLVHLFEYRSVRDMIWNVVGNTAMFIPSGIILPVVYRKLNRFWKVTAVGALISLCIEFLQLPFASRASDIDDLILNTLGTAAGYGIFAFFRRFWLRK